MVLLFLFRFNIEAKSRLKRVLYRRRAQQQANLPLTTDERHRVLSVGCWPVADYGTRGNHNKILNLPESRAWPLRTS